MTSLIGGLFLAYLLSASFTDQVQLNVTPVQKLVDYHYNLDFVQLVPGEPYTGSIVAGWAVPQSALAGIADGPMTVRVTASADANSTVYFLSPASTQATEVETYLRCDVANGSCANTSVLSATIPVMASAMPDSSQLATISLRSEIVEGSSPALISAGSILNSLENAFSQNNSTWQGNSTLNLSLPGPGLLQANSTNLSAADFLDSLKPAGDSKNTLQFLTDNPIVSLTALVIVIVITGAYLLNAKD